MQLFFSSGQVAEDLGVSQDYVRRLCQAGVVRAELTQGGQFRIPQAERERLLKEGPPRLPRPLPGDKGRPTASRAGAPPLGLLAQPSDDLIEKAEEVARRAYEVQALRLQRRIDAEADRIRRREARIEQEQREQEETIQARLAAQQAEKERAGWLQGWEEYALRNLPYNATAQVRLDVHQQVRERLSDLDPLPTAATVQRVIQAIVDEAMRVARCRQESHDIIQKLMSDLPSDLRYGADFELERNTAVNLMGEALDRLPVDAGVEQKQATARLALEPVMVCYRHQLACQALLQGLYGMIPRANQAEKQEAWKALGAALQQVPVGASQTKLEAVRAKVVSEALERVEQRLSDERRQAEERARQREEARRRSEAEFRVTMAISHVDEVLKELEREGEVEFGGWHDRWETGKKMRETVSPLLVEELVKEPEVSTEQVQKRVGALVRKSLSAVVPD